MRKSILRRILFGVLTVLCAVIFLMPPHTAEALTTPIDEIETYTITVSVNDSGSMNVSYLITWKVLDDQKEGPLTWVKVGVPNGDVNSIKATTDTVKKAKFVREGNDTYIRIDLNDEYHAGEEVTFGFSCVMYNMFEGVGDKMVYRFTPGWFDDIEVKNYVFKWKADKVSSVSPERPDSGGFYVWTGSLAAGERVDLRINYARDAFNFKRRYIVRWDAEIIEELLRPIFAIILAIGAIAVRIKFGDRYDGEGRYFGGHHFHGGGGGCACACACACAGGGRAGCSSKDFYGTKLESARVRKRLRAELKEK